MPKLHFSILIDAPKEHVWNTMLEDKTYREWTEPFAKGSHYVGDWSQGSKMLFLGPGENGMSGMVSRIKENRLGEYLSIEHLGMVQNGIEDLSSEKVKDWSGALENYTFQEVDGKTEVIIDLEMGGEEDSAHIEMFKEMWPPALEKLKTLAEL
ncbi:MAG: SRPBCC domain-containing protein [Patescibacteria group bacterium]